MGCAPSNHAKAHDTKNSEVMNGDFHDFYYLGAKLGRGAFAQVRIATPVKAKADAEEMAVKILDLRDEEEPETMNKKLQTNAQKEASIWLTACHHENIIKLHDVYHDDCCCYYVMEKCAGGLFQHLDAMPDLNERSLGCLIAQMLTALSHVHSVGIVHRDVKPDNFLMGGRDGLQVKLADFGLSAFIHDSQKLKGSYGTAPFMCPEMVRGQHYDEKADVWSLGVLAYALIFGDFPYTPKHKCSKAMKQAILEGRPPKFEPVAPFIGQMRTCSVLKFIQTLLLRDPKHRPLAKDALQLPYMTNVRNDEHMLDEDLPSLRPMLKAAKKAGAFEFRDLTKEGDLDTVLNKKQKAKRGKALPVAESSWEPKSSVQSNVWSVANSWNNATSFSTTASALSNVSSPAPSQMGSFSPVNSAQL